MGFHSESLLVNWVVFYTLNVGMSNEQY